MVAPIGRRTSTWTIILCRYQRACEGIWMMVTAALVGRRTVAWTIILCRYQRACEGIWMMLMAAPVGRSSVWTIILWRSESMWGHLNDGNGCSCWEKNCCMDHYLHSVSDRMWGHLIWCQWLLLLEEELWHGPLSSPDQRACEGICLPATHSDSTGLADKERDNNTVYISQEQPPGIIYTCVVWTTEPRIKRVSQQIRSLSK